MRAPLRSTLALAAAATLVAWAPGVAGATSPPASLTVGPADVARAAVLHATIAPRGARVLLAPTCSTVPASLVARILGTSVTKSGPGSSTGLLNEFGQNVLVGGKTLKVTWWSCDYDHNPVTHVGLGVSVSYLTEPTAARALSITKALCSTMRPFSSSWATPRIGSTACLQGHTGAMQSSNAFLAEGNVVVQLFGSQSPTQSLALLRAIAPLVAKAHAKTPVITVTTTQYAVTNGYVSVGLSCTGADCAGVVTLTAPINGATVTLARVPYQMGKASQMSLNVTLNPEGTNYLGHPSSGPVTVTLTVTVGRGRTVVQQISVSSGVSPTTTSPPFPPGTTTTVGP